MVGGAWPSGERGEAGGAQSSEVNECWGMSTAAELHELLEELSSDPGCA
jgi:hypothetical protein